MRDRIHIQLVTTEAEFLAARDFLRTFAHEIVPGMRPIRIIRRGDKIIAVDQVMQVPLHITTWSTDPEVCTPRDVLDGANALRVMEEGFSENTATYCTVTDGSPFNEDVMDKIGYTDTKLRIFASQPNFDFLSRRLEKPDPNSGGAT